MAKAKPKNHAPRRIRKGEPGYGKKKFVVRSKGKTVRFGDANLDIKRDSAARRKNFRKRHKCATATDRTTARYWSCKMWQKGKTVGQMTGKKKKKR